MVCEDITANRMEHHHQSSSWMHDVSTSYSRVCTIHHPRLNLDCVCSQTSLCCASPCSRVKTQETHSRLTPTKRQRNSKGLAKGSMGGNPKAQRPAKPSNDALRAVFAGGIAKKQGREKQGGQASTSGSSTGARFSPTRACRRRVGPSPPLECGAVGENLRGRRCDDGRAGVGCGRVAAAGARPNTAAGKQKRKSEGGDGAAAAPVPAAGAKRKKGSEIDDIFATTKKDKQVAAVKEQVRTALRPNPGWKPPPRKQTQGVSKIGY
jgi:hypothetical protein